VDIPHPLAVWLAPTMMALSPGCAESIEDHGEVFADDIPVANTPDCGWVEWPDPVLITCTEPLLPEAADLRGIWEGYEGERKGNIILVLGSSAPHMQPILPVFSLPALAPGGQTEALHTGLG
jgi:hypothetical protein